MVYYYVRNPIQASTTCSGWDCKCGAPCNGSCDCDPGDTCCHPHESIRDLGNCQYTASYLWPTDVDASYEYQPVYAVFSATVQSWIPRYADNICMAEYNCNGSPYVADRGLILELYTSTGGGGSLIGRVVYGHVYYYLPSAGVAVNCPVASSETTFWATQLGTVLDDLDIPSLDCYKNHHVHMQASTGSGSGLIRYLSSCTSIASQGNIYRFNR